MKYFLLFSLLWPAFASAQLQLPFSIKLLKARPLDGYYYNSVGDPYSSAAQVLSQVSALLRYPGQTFNVSGTEYWFATGTLDADLVPKGLFYIPSGNGPPSSAPATLTGMVAMYYDVSADQLYIFSGSWKKVSFN